MIELSLETVVTGFVVAGLLFFFSLWSYYDRRDKRYYDVQRHRRTYHCVRCGALYESSEMASKVDCPDCGFSNGPLQF